MENQSTSSTPFRKRPGAAALATLAAMLALSLTACGGGGSTTSTPTAAAASQPVALTVPTASSAPVPAANTPVLTGNTATDGLNWFNYRRSMLGEPLLARVAAIDTAAQGHSNYQQLNNTITHDQIIGKPGFTGATEPDRLTAANYRFSRSSYAYGEVISSTVDNSGVNAAEDLITAIYHRFVIFEPMFRQAGAGSAVSSGGRTYFTVDLTADGLTPALGSGKFLVYPADQQQGLPTNFYSDYEVPDPVPSRNEVGYPISVHADITSAIAVSSFTVNARGGAALQTVLLQNSSDVHTPASAAAIVPVNVLAAGTTYDVQFSGTVDGVAVARNWSFMTR